MATLRNVSGASFVPDLGQTLADLLQPIGERLQLEKATQGALAQGGPSSQVVDDAALGRLGQVSPQMAQAVGQAQGNTQASAELREQAQRGLTLSEELQALPDHAARLRRLSAEGGTINAEGGDLSRLVELSNLDEGQLDLELQRMQLIGNDVLSSLPPPPPSATDAFASLISVNPQVGLSLLGRRDTQIAQERTRRERAAAARAAAARAAATPKTELGRQIQAIESDISSEFIRSEIGEQQIASLRAASVAGVPFEGVTDLGKIIQDENAIIATFGADSPQAQAFAELRNSTAEGDPPSLSDIGGIRKEFTSQSGDFVIMRNADDKIRVAAEDPSAAGDLSLIFNYMKILDPNSVVRESEFATAANAAGVPDRIRNTFNRVLSGERLAENQREDFVDTARRLFDSQLNNQRLLEREFTGIAERANINPQDVIVDFVGTPAEQSAGISGTGETPTTEVSGEFTPATVSAMSQDQLSSVTNEEIQAMDTPTLQAYISAMEQ